MMLGAAHMRTNGARILVMRTFVMLSSKQPGEAAPLSTDGCTAHCTAIYPGERSIGLIGNLTALDNVPAIHVQGPHTFQSLYVQWVNC